MRRKAGVGGLHQKKKETVAFASAGKIMDDVKMAHVQETIDAFKKALEEFAGKHKSKINQDPEFRFQVN